MRKRSFIILAFFAIALMLIGIILYYINSDKIAGIYVRKMYGSMGNLEDNEVSITYETFNFGNTDYSFLQDIEHISFNTQDATITNISLELQNEVKDLKIYNMVIDVRLNVTGSIVLNELIYSKDNEEYNIDLGGLTIVNQENERTSFSHATDSSFYENEAKFSFLSNNKKHFIVEEIICQSENIKSIEYEKNVVYNPGQDLDVPIKISYNVNEFDNFILLPIITIRIVDTDEIVYFTPGTYVSSYEPMTYTEIKEYVK